MLQLISWKDNRMAAQTSSRWSTAEQCMSTTGSSHQHAPKSVLRHCD